MVMTIFRPDQWVEIHKDELMADWELAIDGKEQQGLVFGRVEPRMRNIFN